MPKGKKTKSPAAKGVHMCFNCSHAYLMRSRKENPIVSLCKHPLNRGQRWVAKMSIYCELFNERKVSDVEEAEIHPMLETGRRY